MLIFIIYTIVTIIFALSILSFFTSLNKSCPDVLFIKTSFIVFITSLFTLLILFSNTQIETIYEGNWKEIYPNNIKVDVEFHYRMI